MTSSAVMVDRLARLSLVVVLAALSALVEPGAAHANAPRSASLSWVRLPGAESCTSGPRLATLVERWLGEGALAPLPGAELSIEGRIARTAEGTWKATLALVQRDGGVLGTRELTSAAATCDAIEPELALVLAVMIDPEVALANVPPAPSNGAPVAVPVVPEAPGSAGPACPPAAVVPVALPPPQAATPAPPTPPWRIRAALGPAISLGLVPSLGAGGRLSIALGPPRIWTFEMSALFTAPAGLTTPEGVGADFTLALGRLSACPLAREGDAWSFAACAGLEAGVVRGRGMGLPLVLGQDLWIVNAALHARFERRLAGPLFATASLGVGVPVLRARFYYDAAGGAEREIFVTAPFSGSADLSLGVRLP